MPMQHAGEGCADSVTYPSPSWKVEGSLANLHGYSFRMEPDGQSNLDFGVSARIEGRDDAARCWGGAGRSALDRPRGETGDVVLHEERID